MSAAQEGPGARENLSLVQKLIVTLSEKEGDAGLVQLFYNLFSSGGIDLTQLGQVEPDGSKSDSLLDAEKTTGKIFDELYLWLFAKAEEINLVDSVFPIIEATLVSTRQLLTNLPEGLFLEELVELPDLSLRPHASPNVQSASGRQNALTHFPQRVNKTMEWSFWSIIKEGLDDPKQIKTFLKLINRVLNLMSDHHFADAHASFQKLLQELAVVQAIAEITPLPFQITTILLDEAMRFAEHVKEIVPDGPELDLLRQLATLITTKSLVLGSGETLNLSEAGLLPHHVFAVFADTPSLHGAPTGNSPSGY